MKLSCNWILVIFRYILVDSASYALSLFPPRSLLPFSFLPIPLPEGPHTLLEGLASQVL